MKITQLHNQQPNRISVASVSTVYCVRCSPNWDLYVLAARELGEMWKCAVRQSGNAEQKNLQ